MTTAPGPQAASRSLPAALMTASVFLVVLCLRPALTMVGPLLPFIGADEGLSEGALGVLGALPLVAFGVASPFVHHLSRRLGAERSLLLALLVLAFGTVARSYTGDVGLWAGTAVIGLAITVGNVIVPTLLAQDYPGAVARATGIYSAMITLSASTASAVAVPLAQATDWRFSLAVWALLALLVAAAWIPRVRRAGAATAPVASRAPRGRSSVWLQSEAWLVTVFMGLQSMTFYILVTWLPTIEGAEGVPAEVAGLHLFVFQAVGIVAGLAVPLIMRGRSRYLPAILVAALPVVLLGVGFLLAPQLALIWAAVAGFGSNAALIVALTLVSEGARDHHERTRLSGMAQSVGYLMAAAGPSLAGLLTEMSGSWTGALLLVAGLAAAQLLAGTLAARAVSRRRSS